MNMLAVVVVVCSLIAAGGGLAWSRSRRRRNAGRLLPGEQLLRRADGVSARVFVERDLLAGPRAHGINQAKADVILTDKRLTLATHHGRLLEITREVGGSVRCVGPRRLVIEVDPLHSKGSNKLRAELVLDDAEAWAQDAERQLGTQKAALTG